MNETKTQLLMCDNPKCPNFGYNLLWTDPNEWEPCCEAQVKRHDEALSKLNYNPAELYRKTYAELDELYPDADDPPTVQLIASGYEWTCPACEHFNHEIEIGYSVTCENCNHEWETSDAHHAYG